MLLIPIAALAMLMPPAVPKSASTPAEVAASDHGKLPWFEGSYADVLTEAKAKNKIIFIDIWREN